MIGSSTKAAESLFTSSPFCSSYDVAMRYMKRAEAREIARHQQAEPRRIYVRFFVRGAGEWVLAFLETDARTPIGRRYSFGSADKVRELIGRTPTRL